MDIFKSEHYYFVLITNPTGNRRIRVSLNKEMFRFRDLAAKANSCGIEGEFLFSYEDNARLVDPGAVAYSLQRNHTIIVSKSPVLTQTKESSIELATVPN